MKRLAVAVAAVALLVVGSAVSAFAAPDEQTPTPPQGQQGWWCHDWGSGTPGNYDLSTNPTVKRLAEKIGVSAADLAKELQAGKSVMDVAKTRNVTEQALVDVLLAPQIDMLKLQQKYGFLNQERIDAMQKFMAEQARNLLNQKGFGGGGFGMMGGGYGMMGGFGGYGMMGGGYGGGGYGGMMGGGYGGMMGGSGWGAQGTSYYY